MDYAQEKHVTNRNTLAPCPDSFNCVSTKSTDPDRAMLPLPYVGTREKSHERLILVLHGMKRCTIITADPGYIHAEFRSALFGFVDDVNFIFDNDERLVHFRSASRKGYYDFGANRKRMKEITEQYMNPSGEKNRTAI
jgi:uncharacterized protein (DUF1499 family)